MLLVFVAHYLQEIASQVPAAEGRRGFLLLEALTNVAAPAFVLISGLTLALTLSTTATAGLPARKRAVLERAAFILVVGHPVLTLTDALLAGTPRPWNQVFITDTIAICLVVALLVLPGWPTWRLGALAVLSFASGWWIHLQAPRFGGLAHLLTDVLSGPDSAGPLSYGFAVLQWGAVFLVGAMLGKSLASRTQPGHQAAWGRSVAVAGLVAATCAVLLRLVIKLTIVGSPAAAVLDLLSLGARTPPGPLHLMVFGGLSCTLLGMAVMLAPRHASRPASLISLLGRTSLFVFLLQSLVYRDVVSRVPLTSRWSWPAWFALSVVAIWFAASRWEACGGNRWFRLSLAPERR